MTSRIRRAPAWMVQLWRGFRRASCVAIAASAVALLPAPVYAVSADDIVQLAKAGLSDEVLIALIQTDNTVFPLDAERILELRAAGVSEAVIVAMLRNGRPSPSTGTESGVGAPAPYAPELDPTLMGYDDPSYAAVPSAAAPVAPVADPSVYQPAAAAPVVYVPYPMVVSPGRGVRHQPVKPYRGFGRFINDGWVERGGAHKTSP